MSRLGGGEAPPLNSSLRKAGLMAKHKITLEVDGSVMFDTIASTKDHSCSQLGFALSSILMTGDQSAMDAVRLAMFGVSVVAVEMATDQPTKE